MKSRPLNVSMLGFNLGAMDVGLLVPVPKTIVTRKRTRRKRQAVQFVSTGRVTQLADSSNEFTYSSTVFAPLQLVTSETTSWVSGSIAVSVAERT